MNSNIKHGGTGSSYDNYGCRCQDCKAAHLARHRANKERWRAQPKDPDDPRHGTPSFYNNHGCRCDKCRAVWREKCKRVYDARKAKTA